MTAARRLLQLPSLLTLSGGALLAAGAVAPWLVFYGGLQPYPGVTGWWGRLLLIGGIAAVAVTVVAAATRRALPGSVLMVVGIAAGILAATRLQQAHHLVQSGDAVMLVPAVGPGLWIVIAGSLALSGGGIGMMVGRMRRLRGTEGLRSFPLQSQNPRHHTISVAK